LESDECSKELNKWIDLIWGFQQTGDAAVSANNTFDPLMYPGGDSMDSSRETILRLVGQIPFQLFTAPHPVRPDFVRPSLGSQPVEFPVGQSRVVAMIVQGATLDAVRIVSIHQNSKCYITKRNQQKVVHESADIPSDPWITRATADGFYGLGTDGNVVFFSPKKRQILKSATRVHLAGIQGIASSGDFAVTGGSDSLVALWSVCKRTGLSMDGQSVVHNDCISAVEVSHEYGIVVSCSVDGLMCVLRMPSLDFIRSVDLELVDDCTPSQVVIARGSGDIVVVCQDPTNKRVIVRTFTINCTPIHSKTFRVSSFTIFPVMDHRRLDYLIAVKDRKAVELMDEVSLKRLSVVFESDGEIEKVAVRQDSPFVGLVLNSQTFVVVPFSFP
jgi:WD40 repeat protein